MMVFIPALDKYYSLTINGTNANATVGSSYKTITLGSTFLMTWKIDYNITFTATSFTVAKKSSYNGSSFIYIYWCNDITLCNVFNLDIIYGNTVAITAKAVEV